MRRWTRDRNKRRKQQGDKPAEKTGQPEGPAPLQPRFPDPVMAESPQGLQPEFEAQPDESELQESQPMAETPAAVRVPRRSGAIATGVADDVGVADAPRELKPRRYLRLGVQPAKLQRPKLHPK